MITLPFEAWHRSGQRAAIVFEGRQITGVVDGAQVLDSQDRDEWISNTEGGHCSVRQTATATPTDPS